MTFNNLNLQLEAGIGMLTINRPKKLNALNKATILELHQALKAMDQDQNVRESPETIRECFRSQSRTKHT